MNRRADLDRQYLGLLEDVAFRPVFIMGDHRTGTTILYKILGATDCFNIVTAYHIINYHEIIHHHLNQSTTESQQQLAARFDQDGLRDRVIDRLPVTPDMPEEYGFILGNRGFRHWLKPDNVARLVELCKKIQLVSDSTRPLLLKNPWDFFLNFPYVKEVFPDSRFVFIHRHPIRTINSQLLAIRSALNTQNHYVALIADWYSQIFRQPFRRRFAQALFSSHFDLGLRIVTRHVALGADYFLKHLPRLPQSDYVSVRYEDLCKSPDSVVAKVLDSLGLQEKAAVEYETLIDVRSSPLLPEVKRHRASIFTRMKPYFDYCGYELEDPPV